MSTSIGRSRAALYTLLTAAAGNSSNPLYNVQICFGPPDAYEEPELVAILGIRTNIERSVVLGPQPNVRDEQYDIEVAIKCHKPAGTSIEVETRCVEMYEAVRALITGNNRLGLTNLQLVWAFPTGEDSDGPVPVRKQVSDGREVGDGWAMRFDLRVQCKARA